MKKIFISVFVIASLFSCKKDNASTAKLEELIKNKDVKGLQAFKEKERKKLDSINMVMSQIDQNLLGLGVNESEGLVSGIKLQETSFQHFVEIQGNVTTDQDVMVQPQFSGVLSLFVKQGQQVGRGQVIGRVADGGLNDQLKQAQIQVATINAQLQQVNSQANLAKILFEKQAALWKQKIGSEFQYLQAKTNYEATQKQVVAAQNQVAATQKAADAVKAALAKTAIIAPFSGVIDQVITQNGQVVSPGMNIVKLISLGTMRVEAKVPETYLASIKPGTDVDVFLPAINKTIQSRVRLVGNFIDPATRTFIIQVPIANQGGIVKPNLMAQVKIQDYLNPSALQLPSQYIFEDAAHKNFVFVATNINGNQAVAKKVYIETGKKSGNSVEITLGLKSGDFVLTDGSKNLSDNQKIKITN